MIQAALLVWPRLGLIVEQSESPWLVKGFVLGLMQRHMKPFIQMKLEREM
ncbi:hypothetical protein [Providencia hangzhouensis]